MGSLSPISQMGKLSPPHQHKEIRPEAQVQSSVPLALGGDPHGGGEGGVNKIRLNKLARQTKTGVGNLGPVAALKLE